jgi:hypothetical protein
MERTISLVVLLACSATSALGQLTYASPSGKPVASYHLHASCDAVVQPDMAVIAGGVTGKGLKPSDAVRQLEKQLEVMSNYVQGQHGRLVLMERVRALKAPRANANSSGSEENDQPAEVIQHIHVELSPEAPVDTILDRLIELGMDRYGDSNLLNRSTQSSIVVQFRLSNLESRLLELRHKCLEAAFKLQCVADDRPRACSGDKLPDQLAYETFNVRSVEKLLRANASSDFLRFNFNNGILQNMDPPELAGGQPIKLVGEFSAQYGEQQ